MAALVVLETQEVASPLMSGAETVTQVVLALEVPIVSVTVSRSFIELDEPNGRVV